MDKYIIANWKMNNDFSDIEPYVDYLKVPKIIELTDDDLESDVDSTAVVEFPEYACFEIINEFTKLLLENASDPRLQTNIPINQSIGSVK